jgi:hypothetical protein
MLGIIHDIKDVSESVYIKEGDKFVILRGKRLEVKLEENNELRLSFVKTVENRHEQHFEAVSRLKNLLDSRRKDLSKIKQELKDITSRLDNEDMEENEEEWLEKQYRAKRSAKKRHEKEIKKLGTKTSITVHYRIAKTGVTAVLPTGLTCWPKFLPEPVCWCPFNVPKSSLVDDTTTEVDEMPVTITCPQKTTATGIGLTN